MHDRTLIHTGTVGATVAAICCATPALAVLLPLVGLGAWLATADVIVIPLLFVFLGLLTLGLYRRRATTRCETNIPKESLKA